MGPVRRTASLATHHVAQTNLTLTHLTPSYRDERFVVIEIQQRRWHDRRMEYNEDKVDEMVLALLFLTLHEEHRAWKGHDWAALGRLHEKGMISDPVGKAKSVVLTEQGEKQAEVLFRKHFCS
jgi:hypothetical protein